MKDYLLELAGREENPGKRMNMMREYLQSYILRTFQEIGYFQKLAFVGGTALRFLFDLPRFSEDLDFSLENKEGYDFRDLLEKIKKPLNDAAYDVDVKFNEQRTVHSAFLKFPKLLHLAKLSHRENQNLSIKLEIDTKPPPGAKLTNTLINRYFPLNFWHYDLPSLFAGKIHALLTRPYTKGRDYYDLAWYLTNQKGLEPNFNQLSAALKQTQGEKAFKVDSKNWKKILVKTVKDSDWNNIVRDVSPFLERPDDINYFSIDAMVKLLGE
ncbi:MAG: nucleotidyl transferase AbiEii/AbiGii toxin family protein [Pseudomonadota bacterium]